MEQDPVIELKLIFGHVRLDGWFERRGADMVAMGRRRSYDAEGRCTEDKTEPLGFSLRFEP